MKPFVKWAGGKEHELPIIIQNMPNDINNYIEPFLGGGALYFAISQNEINGKLYVNDFSKELIQLYKEIYEQDSNFYNALIGTCIFYFIMIIARIKAMIGIKEPMVSSCILWRFRIKLDQMTMIKNKVNSEYHKPKT